MTQPERTILFAGGGTGGHLSPGLAVAESLARRAPGVRRLFLCSNRAIDSQMLRDAGERFEPSPAQPLNLKPAGLISFLRGWRATRRLTRKMIERENVAVVLALGGFVAGPAAREAARRGVAVILLNLDAVPGRANRLVSRWAHSVISTCATPGIPGFTKQLVPMPLRESTLAPADPATCRRAFGLDPARPTLLITGASQGAKSLNDLMRNAAESYRAWLDGWQVIHLAGPERGGDLESVYRKAEIPARVLEFQKEMGLAWGAADLAISRAGANSVAEIAANAVPTVFLPYPFHHDQHQRANARPLAEAGGAIILNDHIEAAMNLRMHGDRLRELLADESKRTAMRQALVRIRPKNGADIVADLVLKGGRP